MSDGDNATPGPCRDDENPWLTRTPRRSFGAAPWERSGIFAAHDSGDGNHAPDSNSISVAELIAKVGGGHRRHTSRHRAEPPIEPEEPPAPEWQDPHDASKPDRLPADLGVPRAADTTCE